MKKTRLTNELIAKAVPVFKLRKQIKTNEGLTRAELRCLERNGIVSSKMFQGVNIWWIEKFGIDELAAKVYQ